MLNTIRATYVISEQEDLETLIAVKNSRNG
jgi:hypothetical protein